MTYERYDIVIVPFPFTETQKSKRRPALILSDAVHFNNEANHSVLAMITSARYSHWPLDVKLEQYESAGLPGPCIIRFKIFTLDHQLFIDRAGSLGTNDRHQVQQTMQKLLAI